MTAGVYTVAIEQGSTFRLRLTLRLPTLVPGEPGALMDLSNFIARMQIRHRTPAPEKAVRLFEETKKRGLLIGKGGLYGNVIRISPPLVVSAGEVDDALKILDESLAGWA